MRGFYPAGCRLGQEVLCKHRPGGTGDPDARTPGTPELRREHAAQEPLHRVVGLLHVRSPWLGAVYTPIRPLVVDWLGCGQSN